ncbi:hypothetical protein Cyast_0650 [Cyanobacterium stanieri PCC 7202]|uniref:Uncharacterized protein n=1 Tax=Cyanobacterium stanieri (strain ATCC 29140 / PCC 7202) TaxID=292563 RepID=K9YI31_CYASC|nr:hypothetical protein Cyast_0650 [Cyanobacterium stanieri PCC 7202]
MIIKDLAFCDEALVSEDLIEGGASFFDAGFDFDFDFVFDNAGAAAVGFTFGFGVAIGSRFSLVNIQSFSLGIRN